LPPPTTTISDCAGKPDVIANSTIANNGSSNTNVNPGNNIIRNSGFEDDDDNPNSRFDIYGYEKYVLDADGFFIDYKVNDFLGIKGLTCTYLRWFQQKNAGQAMIAFGLSYTSNDPKNNYNWYQNYSENGGPWKVDNTYPDYTGNVSSGSDAYYTPVRLAKHINGNTITWNDRPRNPSNSPNYKIEFVLTLRIGRRIIFSIHWGYKVVNGVTIPIYPTKIK